MRHPEFADDARCRIAFGRIRASHIPIVLHCRAVAAKKYAERLARLFGAQENLPDLFSKELEIFIFDDVEKCLQELGERNVEMRGLKLNWGATYEHAPPKLGSSTWNCKQDARTTNAQ